MEKKDKINFDLDFLEKGSVDAGSKKPVSEKKSEPIFSEPSLPMKRESKWLIGFAIVVVIVLIGIASDESGTSSPSTTTNTPSTVTASDYDDGLIATGQYRCSQYHHNRAGELEPATSEGATLDAKTQALSAESDRMDSEKYDLENEYVDEYDQWSIDQHNERIDDYNASLQGYQTRTRMHQANIDSYNARVETYNNYLTANCTRAY